MSAQHTTGTALRFLPSAGNLPKPRCQHAAAQPCSFSPRCLFRVIKPKKRYLRISVRSCSGGTTYPAGRNQQTDSWRGWGRTLSPEPQSDLSAPSGCVQAQDCNTSQTKGPCPVAFITTLRFGGFQGGLPKHRKSGWENLFINVLAETFIQSTNPNLSGLRIQDASVVVQTADNTGFNNRLDLQKMNSSEDRRIFSIDRACKIRSLHLSRDKFRGSLERQLPILRLSLPPTNTKPVLQRSTTS